MKICYCCDNCNTAQILKSFIFNCIFCEKEICSDCMDGCSTCKGCSYTHSLDEIKDRYNEKYEN